MSIAEDLVAVPDLQHSAAAVGGIVYWRLSGAVDYEDLEQAWSAAGLSADLLPATVSRQTALKRAMATFREPGVMVRPLRGEDDGFVLVHESYDAEGKPRYRTGRTVILGPDPATGAAAPVVKCLDGEHPMAAEVVELQRQVDATFVHHLNHLSQQDISGWLVDLVCDVAAVRLRDTGGIYFVPGGAALTRWQAYASAVRAASRNALFTIRAMRGEDAVEAVLDSLANEAEKELGDIGELGDDPSGRMCTMRAKRLAVLEGKLGQYEALLGVKLDALRAQCGEVSSRIVEAALAADEE